MGDTNELDPVEVALYRAALLAPGETVAALAARIDRQPADVDKAVRRLLELGLLRGDGADSGADPETTTVSAMSPMLAEATVLGVEDLELAARRASVEAKRNTIRRLVVDWNETLSAAAVPDVSVDVITDQNQIGNVLMHYADRCTSELLSVAPGRLPKTRIDSRTRIANLYSARRGIRSRLLYQQVALRDRHTRAYLAELCETGARIRVAISVPGRSLVVDREVALLPIPSSDPQQPGLAVVREPNVIAWVVATFEQLWAEAQPLEDVLSRRHDESEMDQTRLAILRLMAEGEKDEAIARRLSISVRTCRRQIADYMTQVGATSRFQAGVVAARSGHLDVGTG